MYPIAAPHGKSLFSYTGLQPDPPMTSVLEQHCWAELSDQHNRVSACNQLHHLRRQCRPPHSGKIHHRPSTSHARLPSHCSGINVMGAKVKQISRHVLDSDSDEQSIPSRCSTPEFMHGIYDIYSQSSRYKCPLLRRPIATTSYLAGDESSSVLSETAFDRIYDESEIAAQTNASDVDILTDTDKALSEFERKNLGKRTVKVAIDIPLCDTSEVTELTADLDEENQEELADCKDHNDSNTNPGITSESDLSAANNTIRPRTASKTRRKTKNSKKRNHQHKKKQVHLTTITVDYDNEEKPTQKTSNSENKYSWKSRDDEIITQMATLGLSKPMKDDELKQLLREKSCQLINLRKKPTENYFEKNESPQQMGKERCCASARTRRIPIQIISDPFKCTGPRTNANNDKPRQRPKSANPCVKRKFSPILFK